MSANLGSASGSIHLEVAQARQNVKALAGDLRNFSSQVGSGFAGASAFIDQHEQSIRTVGLGLTGLGLAATGLFSAGVWNAANVEEAFSIMQAGTGATGEDLDRLQQKALQLGKDTYFSATEAAAAITELGKAGMPVETILGGAADAVVDLATAGEMDLAMAATVLTNAMNQYGIAAENATDVTNILARGAAVSTADVHDLAVGLSYVGTTAQQLGIGLPHTTAALAALNDQGIRGQKAGTTLNQMLTSIINPSQKASKVMDQLGLSAGGAFELIDSQTGQMKALPDIISNVHEATKDLTEAERQRYINQIFGDQGGRAMNALLQTQTEEARKAGKAWEDYETGVESGATAAEVAATKMDNLKGDLEQLKGGLETLSYTAMKAFLPAFRAVVQGLDALLSAIIGLPPGLQTVIAGIVGLVGVLALGAGGFLLMLPRINDTIKAYKALRTALASTQLAQRGLALSLRGLITAHPVLLAVMALAAAGILAYKTNFLGFRDAVQWVIEKVQSFIKTFRQMYDLVSATGKYDGPVAALRALGFAVADLLGLDLKRWVTIFTEIGVAVNRPIQAIKKFVNGFRELIGAVASGDWDKALRKFRKIMASIGDFLGSPAKAIGALLKSIKTGFKPLDKVLTNLGRVWTNFGRLIQEVFQGDISGALEVGKRLLRAFADYLLSLGPLIWQAATAIGRLLIDAFRAIDWGAVGDFLLDGLKGAIAGLADVAGEIGEAAGGIWDWITESIADIDWGGVRDTLQNALETAIAGLSAALDWILETGIPAISGWIVDIAGDVWGGLKRAAGWAEGAIPAAIELALKVLDSLKETALSGFASAKDWIVSHIPWLDGPLTAVGESLDAIITTMLNVAGEIVNGLGEAWGSLKTLIASIYAWLGDIFGFGDDGTITDSSHVANAALDLAMNLAGTFVSALGEAWSGLKTLIGSLFGWIPDFFGISDDGAIGAAVTKAASAGFDLAFNLAGQFLSTLADTWSSVTSLIGSVAGWIAGFFGIGDSGDVTAAATTAASAGFELSFSLAGSLASTLSDAWSSARSLVASVFSWLGDFFGISDAGEAAATATAIKTASGGFNFAFSIMGSLINYLGDAWSSLTGLIGSIGSWLADFFGITDAGEVGDAITKTAEATFQFTTYVFGAARNFLGEGWSSVGDLVNKAAHWISDFFGIKSASDLGQTVSKTASAALTLATEFKDDITDNLDSAWDSVTSLVGSVGSVAKDLVTDTWGGVTKTVSSTVDLVVKVTGSVVDAIGGGLEWIFGSDSEGSPAVSLEAKLEEVATAIENGITRIAEAFSGFDATGAVNELNTKLVGALDGMSGDSIGSAAKAWVERGLAKIGEGITSESLMTIPRSLDTSLTGAFGMMSGDSISSAIKGWMSRAVALAATGIDGLGLALARSLDTVAGTGFGALSGESLSAGIRGWLARGVALVATQLTVLGTSLAIALDTAAGSGLGTLSGESLSAGLLGWIARAVALTATLLVPLGGTLAIATDTAANAGFDTLSGESLSGALVAWIDRAQVLAGSTMDMTTLATGVASKLQSAIAPKLTEIVTGFRTFAGNVTTEMRRLQTNATREMTTAATNLRQRANTARTDVQLAFRGIESAARTMASSVSREASRAGSDLASQLRNGANQARNAMSGAMNEIVGIVQNAAGRMRSAGYAVGSAAGDGVAAGLESALGRVRTAAQNIINEVDRAMRAEGQIRSPSRVTMWIGQMLGQGPVVGMLSQLRDLRRAAAAVLEAAIPDFDPAAVDPGIGRYYADQLARQRWTEGAMSLAVAGGGPTIGTQEIEINVTQAPGEDGEQLASRVVSLLVDAYNGVNGLGV